MAVLEEFDEAALETWAALILQQMAEHRVEIDGLNVFPVPDGDTGTNMFLTIESACQALQQAQHEGGTSVQELAVAFARGALLGARGNSGVIVSQYIRGLFAAGASDRFDGVALSAALRRGSDQAYAAVAVPKEGTILSVARAAAEAAEESVAAGAADLANVSAAAAQAARDALERTPQQLEALALAGVVDSGGRGLVVLTDAIAEVVTGVHRSLREFKRAGVVAHTGESGVLPGYNGPQYEVMFLLDAEDSAIEPLKAALGALGDSLVVVGGDGLFNVHVHVDDAGAAVEAALVAGRPHRLQITFLASMHRPRTVRGRSIVIVVHGGGLNEALREPGDVIVVSAPPTGRPSTGEILSAIEASGSEEIMILPSDKDTMPVAEAAAQHARGDDRRISVIPTRSIVQSLAAVAVHDAGVPFDQDVVAMTRAAGATKYGGITTASRRAVTSAGVCEMGDELGLISGDIVEIGSDQTSVARRVLDRMLANGGELVTLVGGQDAAPDFVAGIESWLGRAHAGVEVLVFDGQQPRWPLIVGVE